MQLHRRLLLSPLSHVKSMRQPPSLWLNLRNLTWATPATLSLPVRTAQLRQWPLRTQQIQARPLAASRAAARTFVTTTDVAVARAAEAKEVEEVTAAVAAIPSKPCSFLLRDSLRLCFENVQLNLPLSKRLTQSLEATMPSRQTVASSTQTSAAAAMYEATPEQRLSTTQASPLPGSRPT